MRPITKWDHTDPSIDPPISETYNPYQSAKTDLERNIGGYCSYCERPAQDEAVHVEHIQPKALAAYTHLQYSWVNFLLGCARCNGADNKSDKDVIYGQIHLPNLNNTSISIRYGEGGFITVNDTLVNDELRNANALISLVGLDKRPGHRHHLSGDKRWDRRREVWEIAKRFLTKYEAGEVDEDTILTLAQGYGFWSVWYNMFYAHVVVKRLLVEGFKGTALNCFDANYTLVHRNTGHPTDTV